LATAKWPSSWMTTRATTMAIMAKTKIIVFPPADSLG
jgi:hypothetical protein